jgi:hypothetical protein
MVILIQEIIYNELSNHLLLSEFQVREYRIMIEFFLQMHGGTRQMIVKDNNYSDALTIPFDLAGCMIHFILRLPTSDEISTLKILFNTRRCPSNPSSFPDQVGDKFHQQVIDTDKENYIASSTNHPGVINFEVKTIQSHHYMTHQIYL